MHSESYIESSNPVLITFNQQHASSFGRPTEYLYLPPTLAFTPTNTTVMHIRHFLRDHFTYTTNLGVVNIDGTKEADTLEKLIKRGDADEINNLVDADTIASMATVFVWKKEN